MRPSRPSILTDFDLAVLAAVYIGAVEQRQFQKGTYIGWAWFMGERRVSKSLRRLELAGEIHYERLTSPATVVPGPKPKSVMNVWKNWKSVKVASTENFAAQAVNAEAALDRWKASQPAITKFWYDEAATIPKTVWSDIPGVTNYNVVRDD